MGRGNSGRKSGGAGSSTLTPMEKDINERRVNDEWMPKALKMTDAELENEKKRLEKGLETTNKILEKNPNNAQMARAKDLYERELKAANSPQIKQVSKVKKGFEKNAKPNDRVRVMPQNNGSVIVQFNPDDWRKPDKAYVIDKNGKKKKL